MFKAIKKLFGKKQEVWDLDNMIRAITLEELENSVSPHIKKTGNLIKQFGKKFSHNGINVIFKDSILEDYRENVDLMGWLIYNSYETSLHINFYRGDFTSQLNDFIYLHKCLQTFYLKKQQEDNKKREVLLKKIAEW